MLPCLFWQVPFTEMLDPSAANGMVEKWLLEVEGAMKENVSLQCYKGHADYAKKPRLDWLLDWPGQVVLGVDQIYWTREVEEALRVLRREHLDVDEAVAPLVARHVQHRAHLGHLAALSRHGHRAHEQRRQIRRQSTVY